MFPANLELFGLHLVHWLLSALLPLLITAFALVRLIAGCSAVRRVRRETVALSNQIDNLDGRSIQHLPDIDAFVQSCASPPVRAVFTAMRRDSRDLYHDRWLPDPDFYLSADKLLRPFEARSLSAVPGAFALAAGIAGSLASLLAMFWFPAPNGLRAALILLPGLAGLAWAVFMITWSGVSSKRASLSVANLKHALERRLPVFDDQAGLALLIDNFSDYDRQMNESLRAFTATASRLAESDMADGIRRSVEQVLLDSVAPSIQQAAGTLGSLAGELAGRQERGMQDLAVRFASALTAEFSASLQPVSREIAQMGALMADVRNYIDYAMRALETVRQQSESLLGGTREAMRQMGEARVQMTADFSQVDQKLQQMTASASELSLLFQGNEQGLSQNLSRLSQQFDLVGGRLADIVGSAITAMHDARQAADNQQETAAQYLAAMQGQINQLTGRLGNDISQLLTAVREESAAIAGQSDDLRQQLGSLNAALERSIGSFTQDSAQYVQKTLASLDGSLAELAGRIAVTADEIRDAVDALPRALKKP